MTRWISLILLVFSATGAAAQTCHVDFTIEVTQGVGMIRPGSELPGQAHFTLDGRSFPQEGGTTAHMAQGRMEIGDEIEGPIWTLITSVSDTFVDKVGIFARDVEGLSFAGVDFEGPMAVTLFAPPGTRAAATPPIDQADWDSLTLRRAFFLHTGGQDMLAGDVTDLTAVCG